MKKISNDVFQSKFNSQDQLKNNFINQLHGTEDTREERRFFSTSIQCSLCDAEITDARDSHNALPLTEFRCCDKCNTEKVLPARFFMTEYELNQTQQKTK